MKQMIFLNAAVLMLLLSVMTTETDADSVAEELQKNGLPLGLLPSSVKRYSVGDDGAFSVTLEAPCYAKIEDQVALANESSRIQFDECDSYISRLDPLYSEYDFGLKGCLQTRSFPNTQLCFGRSPVKLAYYGENITGALQFGSISNLDGIETKQLFVWLPVTGIYVDVPATPYIYFEVGILTKRLSLAVFEIPPKCSSDVYGTGLHIPTWTASVSELGGSAHSRKGLQ